MTNDPPRSAPAGYYPSPDGRRRFWDGSQWTDHFAQDSGPPVAGTVGPHPSIPGAAAASRPGQARTPRLVSPTPTRTDPDRDASGGRPWLLPVVVAIAALLVGLIAGSATRGSSGSPDAVPVAALPASTVTVTAPPATVTATVTSTPSTSAAAVVPSTAANPSAQQPSAVPSSVAVPDAVGKDYQTAQDLWRAAGLHVMPAIDALGANRLPLIDLNWVVLSQSPAAGLTVPRDTTITATIKKYTDK